ncbi:MAG: ATP-binding protein [Candidatus Diapherotrites archaeon]
MNNEEIIGVLDSWNFWTKQPDSGVFREKYLDRLEALVETDQIVAIAGVRRSGKSTLMKQFIKKRVNSGESSESFLYVNLEEPRFVGLVSLEFLQQIYDAYLEIVKPKGKPFVLLDEVHNAPKWEQFARGLHEKKEANVIVSDSSSKLLGKELGTLLTGRWVQLLVYPLSFQEFLEFRQLKIGRRLDLVSQKTRIKQLLREYLEFGGFPLVVLKEEKQELISRYFDDIITRDIAERHKIRKPQKLKALAKQYLTSFACPVSFRKNAETIGLSLDSVERFSEYFEQAFLAFFVPKFSFSLKEQQVNPKKVYCIDAGLINMAGFRFSENIGRLYENAVFLSLFQKGKEIFYYKNKNECDFIIKEGKKIVQAIQVAYQIKENNERETKGLLEAMNAFRLKKGTIITDRMEKEEKTGKKTIQYIPLWKWLLEENK